MIKIGDTLKCKPNFLIRYGIPIEHDTCTVEVWDRSYLKIGNDNWDFKCICGSFDLEKDFYLPKNDINAEISNILERTSFVRFVGTTINGAEIEVSLHKKD